MRAVFSKSVMMIRTKNPGFSTRFFLYSKCSKSLYTYSFFEGPCSNLDKLEIA